MSAPSPETLNPYARFLSNQDPLSVITSTTQQIEKLIERVPDEKLTARPLPKKWAVRDILCHLADTEVAFAFRLRQTAAEPHYIIQPYDQDRFAEAYANRTAREGLDAFSAIRRWNIPFIHSASPELMAKAVTHPERGAMTFRTIVETMAGHDLNHLSQISELLR